MDKTPKSVSSSCNDHDGVPEETAMEKVLSDLHALKKLYGLLQRLDETSRALLKKLLDDATRRALLKQANALTTASDSVIPFSLGLASPKKMDQATSSSSTFLNNKEVEMEQILSDLQVLTRLYMLLHKGPADENLDEASKALLMKILEDATQEAVRRQAKMLSGSQVSPALERKLSTPSDCRTRHADPCQKPLASPRPSLLASERSRQLNLQHSTVSSRSSLHVNGHRNAAEEPPLTRLASKFSSRTALPAQHRHQLNLQHSTVSSRSSLHVNGHRNAAEEPPLTRLASKFSSRTALPARHGRQLNLQHSTVSRRSILHRHAVEEPPLARLASKCSSRTALPERHHRQLNLQHSTVSSRSSLHGNSHRNAAEEPPLARQSSKCSSRTAVPARHRPQLNLQHSTVSRRSSLHVNNHRHAAEEPPLARQASKCSSRTALPAQHRRKLNLQHSTISSRSSLQVDGHRNAAEEPPLARHASKCSSRTALPARHRPSQEQQHSSLSLHRSLMAGTSQHGTVTRGTRLANRQDSIRRSSSRGDQWSLERSRSRSRSSGRGDQWSLERSSRSRSRSSGRGDQWSLERSISSRSRRSVSGELSLGPSSRLHGRTTSRHVGTESPSVYSSERLGSELSARTMSRHGVEHVGRGVATPECSSSSNTMATIQSRIRPSNSLHLERSQRRSADEGKTSLERHVSDVSSAHMYSSSVSSGSRSPSSAASLSASTSPTVSPPPRAFANPYCYTPPVTASPKPRAFAVPYFYSPPVTAPRGMAPPVYAPKVSRSMRRRRRQEILEKRVARLRMLKEKIATVIHHRHDHHHHHHHLGGGKDAGPSSRSIVRSAAGHLNSQWQYLTSMFHHAKGKAKNITSRTVAGMREKRRVGGGGGGGGGNMHSLFDAVWRHLKDKRRAAAGVKLRRTANRLLAKKMHWWQRLKRRRGMLGVTAGRPRRRLGHGKAGWL